MAQHKVDMISFIASGAFWGGVIGATVGFMVAVSGFTILFDAPFIAALLYGGLCFFVYSAVPAFIIGAVNGWICGLTTRYYDDPLRDPTDYMKVLRTTGLSVGGVLGGVLVAFTLFATMDGDSFMFAVMIFGVIVVTCMLSATRIAQDHLNDLRKVEASE